MEEGNIREADKWEWDLEEGDIQERNVRDGGREEACKERAQSKEGTPTPDRRHSAQQAQSSNKAGDSTQRA